MTDTYPRRVLAWYGDRHKGYWQHEDGRLTVTSNYLGFDQREQGWVVDTRVDLPQEPPEPDPEPGWYLAGVGDELIGPRVMRLDLSGDWHYPDDGGRSGVDWQIVAPLTDEQVAAIEQEQS